MTFPALLAVISPVAANATSTISVLPGTLASTWAYRRDVAHPPKLLLWLIGPSAIGGTLGTWIVTTTEEKIFATLVPWLILAAALLFALQPLVARLLPPTAATIATLSPKRLWALVTVQFVVGVYGGYFGAGMGIMILGALSYMGLRDVHEMNAVKTLLAGIINIAAAVLFIAQDRVGWHYALPMALAAMLGGYAGARLALKIPAAYVRVTVIGIGLATAIYYFLPKAN
ncbi:MAG: sulfite exporter TauE/SafE family protein [Bryobacter sp.]